MKILQYIHTYIHTYTYICTYIRLYIYTYVYILWIRFLWPYHILLTHSLSQSEGHYFRRFSPNFGVKMAFFLYTFPLRAASGRGQMTSTFSLIVRHFGLWHQFSISVYVLKKAFYSHQVNSDIYFVKILINPPPIAIAMYVCIQAKIRQGFFPEWFEIIKSERFIFLTFILFNFI
jgi:dolichyl-phosphate-mannose--protein O-mannosyl transferase